MERGVAGRSLRRRAEWSGRQDKSALKPKKSAQKPNKSAIETQSLRINARRRGLPMYDASLEGACLDEFKGEFCVPPEKAIPPAQILQVSTVPSVFLYMPDNTWIRVSVGLSDTASMEDRLYNFFIAWKIASTTGKQTGKTGLNLDPSAQPQDSQELQKLLATPIKPLGDAQ